MQIKFTKKTKLSGSYMGSGFGGGGSALDPSSLKFVPYNPDNDTVWDIPDKAMQVKGLISTGDIVAKKEGAVVFQANDISGGSQYLYELLDVEIQRPKNGDILVFNGESQMWCNYDEIVFDGGTYSTI